ncbi:MAG: RNA polymerase sigma-70 factor [Tannerellaceae bacterium]|jgi:RNA polymerase sigma-70 factor (ECF subfamily)|nr:RNA polymerase sigma-70 factor [Tannerellaceae bacterium]
MDDYKDKTAFFTSLFNHYKEPFISFAYSYVRDIHIAEDLYMESMMDFWEKRHDFNDSLNIPAYILVTIKNKALNHLRHIYIKNDVEATMHTQGQRELKLRIASLNDCIPSELFAGDIKQIIREVSEKLPKQTRQIFYLSRVRHRKNKEIAEELNISLKTVEFHISKALKLFSAHLKDYLYMFLFLI